MQPKHRDRLLPSAALGGSLECTPILDLSWLRVLFTPMAQELAGSATHTFPPGVQVARGTAVSLTVWVGG